MSDEPKVEMASEPGTKGQWGKNLFFKADGKKLTLEAKEASWLLVVSFVVVATFLLLQSNDEVKPTVENAIDAPSNVGSTVNLPNEMEAQKIVTAAPSSGSRIKVYWGPQMIARPGAKDIPPGSIIKAVLISSATDGPVKAKALESLSINGENKFEEGTVFLGVGQSNDNRLTVQFSKMIFEDGTTTDVSAQALDAVDSLVGLQGSRLGNEAIKLGASIGLSFAGGLAQGLQENEVIGGAVVKKSDMKNALLNGAATASLEHSRELMNEMRNKKPSFSIQKDTPILIMFIGQ